MISTRNPKHEVRDPKEVQGSKFENISIVGVRYLSSPAAVEVGFGFRVPDFFRTFGFGISRLGPTACLLLILVAIRSAAAEPTAPDALVFRWLSAQTNLQTWSADVFQTRSLKTLAQPVTARGQVWFSAPNRFRWEIAEPAPTIAVRQPHQMLVIYPKLKRAERYPLDGAQAGSWKEMLALLEAGFPRSQSELESRFRIVSNHVSNGSCEVALQPKSASARRLMPLLKIAFATNDFTLRATELQFADGSTMRNEFTNSVLNPRLSDDLFEPKVDDSYKIVEPTKGAGR